MKPLIFLPGRLKAENSNLKSKKKRECANKPCLKNNGPKKLNLTKRPSVRNSFSIVREISSSLITMLLKKSLGRSNRSKRRIETRNFSTQLLKEKELSLKLRSKRRLREEERSLSSNSTTNKQVLTRRLTKSWLTNLSNKRPKDNTK